MNFCGTSGLDTGTSTHKKFDDPFLLPSSEYAPQTMAEAFDFCRYLYLNNPEFRKASQRVTRHFVNDWAISGVDSEKERAELVDYLDYKLQLRTALAEMGDDWSCYGNAFFRVHFPFRRLLKHTNSKGKTLHYAINSFPIDKVKFNLNTLRYRAPDPVSGETVDFDFVDVKRQDKESISIVRYDPREIEILHAKYAAKKQFLWRIPNNIQAAVREGNVFQINNLPRKMLVAIKEQKNFLFSENEMFHFRAPTISGVSDSDWGMPELIANFRLLYQIQIYRKIDEVVGLDYMMPIRMISMDAQGGQGPAKVFDAIQWRKEMQKIIQSWRKDRTSMFAIPSPINYQEIGGQGKSLTPVDLIQYQVNNMLNAMGYPAELYTMSLTHQQLPNAIRLFEQTFWFLHEGFNNFSRWVVNKINKYLNNQRIDVSLMRPSMADNIEKQNITLQLIAQGELPRAAGFRQLGIQDPQQAFKERVQEDIERIGIQQEAEEDFARAQQARASLLATTGEPGAAAAATTPTDVEDKALEMARTWLSIQDDGERSKAMNAARVQDFQMYAMAKEIMEQMRRDGESAGRQQVNQGNMR